MFAELIEHSDKILIGLAAVLGVVIPQAWHIHKTRKDIQGLSEKIVAVDSGTMMTLVAAGMAQQILGVDPKSYYTFGYRLPDGTVLNLPLMPGRIIALGNNLTIQFRYHDSESTGYKLLAAGPCDLRMHAHFTDETIKVLAGAVVNTETGTRYGPGESWLIKKDEFHSCFFEAGSDCNGTFRPPLPTAEIRPVALEGIERGYDFPPHKAPEQT